MKKLLADIKNCNTCKAHLPHGVNPVLTASKKSKIAVIGQAPGRIVHSTGIPWDDKSGERLRAWLNVSNEEFYNPDLFALIPMGFCYPGTGKTGDLAPRKECAPQWHESLFNRMEDLQAILLIGAYAQNYYLKERKRTLTDTVMHFAEYLPRYIALPHPSPRNNIWMKKNPWFEEHNVPYLQQRVNEIIR